MSERRMEKEVRNLEILNTGICLHVYNALCSSLVTNYVQLIFQNNKAAYWNNTANNLIYAGQKALEEQSIIQMVEWIKGNDRDLPPSLNIAHKADLICHRDYLSHPYLPKYFPRMEKFIEQRRHWFDFRPALIWQMQKSINECLEQHKLRIQNSEVAVRPDMVLMVEGILKVSINEKVLNTIPSMVQIHEALVKFRDEYVTHISSVQGKRPKQKKADTLIK